MAAGGEGLLGGLGGGLESLFGGAGGTLGGEAGLAAGTEAGLGGAAAPAAAAGGLAPAGAGSIDIASTLGADVSAFAPSQVGAGADIFGGFSPGQVGFGGVPQIAGSNIAPSTGFSIGEVGGFDPAAMGFGGGGGPATGFGDLPVLGAGGGGPASELTGLAGGGAPGAAGAGGGTAGLPAAGGTGAGGGGFSFDSLGTSALNSLTKNPLGIAAAGAGLGYNILAGQKQTPNQQALTGQAQQMAGQGQQLQQYLQNGTLPPGMQQQVDNAKAAARAQIVSGYASRGQNANPAQNSALAQELAAVDTNALELQGKIATNLLTAGINETNMSANLFQALIQMDATQAKQMGSAISNFASALAGGPKTIQIGGATA